MGHSSGGSLLGKAAVTELMDQRAYILEMQEIELRKQSEKKLKALQDLEWATMEECADLEDFDFFVAWWESDQVPNKIAGGTYSLRIAMLRRRISRLRNYDFIS